MEMMPVVVILLLFFNFSPPFVLAMSGGGDSILLPDDGEDKETCFIPPYSQPLYEVNATERNTTLLFISGRCYLSCFGRYSSMVTNVTLYPVWPFAVVSEDANCGYAVGMIHECTRGCRTMLMDTQVTARTLMQNRNSELSRCRQACNAECREECAGADSCRNPDLIDLWVARTGCTIQCNSRTACLLGCLNAEDIILERPILPLAPHTPPVLTEWNDSSVTPDKGLYRIDLSSSARGRPDTTRSQWNGFMFKIHDLVTTNVTYIWQLDVRNYLNLSSHICRTVEVSFCVVNKYGLTTFSQPTVFFINEDRRQLPNQPYIRDIDESLDERTSFFQHVAINVTWETPQDDMHLTHFVVTLTNTAYMHGPSYCYRTGPNFLSKPVNHTSQRDYSTLLTASAPRGDPIMGCNYTITVISVGIDGNRSASKLYTTKSFADYQNNMMAFSCRKSLQNNVFGNPYFQFFYEITMAAHNLAESNFISRFEISRQIYVYEENDRGTLINYHIPQHPDPPPLHHNFQEGKHQYQLPDITYTRFHIPRRSSTQYFRFELSVQWNTRAMLVTPMLESYVCITRAISEPPSSVAMFTLHNSILMGDRTVLVNASWTPPAETNGALSNYLMCLSPQPLMGTENPLNEDLCKVLPETQTSIVSKIQYDTLENYVFLQIRPSNTFAVGNWSEFYQIVTAHSFVTTLLNTVQPMSPESPITGLSTGEIATTVVIVFIVIVIVCTTCIVCIVCFIAAKRRRKRLIKQTETAPNYMPMFTMSYAPKENPQLLEMDSIDNAANDEWEIAPTDITVDDKLGEGAFGEVYRGFLKGPLANGRVKPEFRKALHLPVAIKLLKDTARGSERQDFLSEIEMMKKVSEGHNPHVVAMLGCVTTQEPLCLITEFVQYGDLLSYLRSSRAIYLTGNISEQEDPYIKLGQLAPADLPSFSYQIAAGMAYLSSIGIVHRDLACRNVLVDADKALKITDFGMSRETEDIYVQKSKGRVPYKWMAIESIIAREFTSASDVWSFGVTLWEIETIGGVPYPGVSNAELLPLLRRGHRMEKPDRCSAEIYDVMLSCWQEDPSQRPSFHTLKLNFNDVLTSQGSDTYVDFSIDPNKLYYKTDDETDIPASRNFLRPSPTYKRRSKKVSPNGSFDVISIQKKSPSPQASPRAKQPSRDIAPYVSMEKVSCSHKAQFLDPRRDGRPSSMMLLKPTQDQERRRKSGLDQDLSRERVDDRYVQEPSALFGAPNAMFENGHISSGLLRRNFESDGKLNTSASFSADGK